MESQTRVPAVELGISIAGTEPTIWRGLVLPESATIPELHRAIQKAFGWQDYHLYGIRGIDRQGRQRNIVGGDDDANELGVEPANGVGLLELVDPAVPSSAQLEYEYDFGDSWTHEIEIIGPAEIEENSILCLDGAMRGHIEDSGGIGGYAKIVNVMANPSQPEYGS